MDRNSFSDLLSVHAIIRELEIVLFDRIHFQYFESNTIEKKVTLTENFLSFFVAYYSNNFSQDYKPVFERMLHFDVYVNGIISQYSLGSILESFKTVALVGDKDYAKEVAVMFNMPVIIAKGRNFRCHDAMLRIFTGLYNMTPYIEYIDKQRGVYILKEKEDPIKGILDKYTNEDSFNILSGYIFSDTPFVLASTWLGADYEFREYAFNMNHPFLKNLIFGLQHKGVDSFNRKLLNSIFLYLYHMHDNLKLESESSLQELNSLLAKLDEQYQYVFKPEDFVIEIS